MCETLISEPSLYLLSVIIYLPSSPGSVGCQAQLSTGPESSSQVWLPTGRKQIPSVTATQIRSRVRGFVVYTTLRVYLLFNLVYYLTPSNIKYWATNWFLCAINSLL